MEETVCMLQLGIWLMWLVLYHYYIEQICNLEKGYKKRVVVWGMTGGALLAVWAVTVAGQISRGSAGGLFTEAGQDPAGAVGALSTVAVSETGEALPSMVGKERSGGNGVWSAEAGQENGVVAGVWSAEAELAQSGDGRENRADKHTQVDPQDVLQSKQQAGGRSNVL